MRYFILFFLLSCTVFSQENNITNAEYYWGQTDPGFGQGVALNAADGEFNTAIEGIIANYSVTQTVYGPILFNLRVKDAEDNWGPTFKKVIFIGGETDTPQQITITGFEYYFGNFDPGEGNGNTIVAFDGALDSAVEEVFRDQTTWNITSGPVLFNIRAKDADGNWGPVFKKTIFPYGANPNAELIAEGDSIEICPGSEVTLTYNGPFGYTPTWFDGSTENTITFTPIEEGSISCSATLNGNTYTDTIEVKFKELPGTDISITGSVLVCSSSNFNLESEENSNYSYQWYLNENEITNATNASYLPTAIGSYTLEITDNNTTCSKISEPTVLTSSFEISPINISNFCRELVLTVPLGSANSYQWKKDNINITNATSNTYTATESGSYTCIINNENCSFTTSAKVINTTVNKPIGDNNQVFNSGDTLEDLNVSGVNLAWYSSPTENSSLPLSTELVSNTSYYVSQTINNCESERLVITVQLSTLSNNQYLIKNISIIPNPAKNIVTVEANVFFNKIEIFNTLGQKIETKIFNKSNNQKINLSKYNTGIYYLKISNEKYSTIKSVIKN
mgnify:CR=1 FL=1